MDVNGESGLPRERLVWDPGTASTGMGRVAIYRDIVRVRPQLYVAPLSCKNNATPSSKLKVDDNPQTNVLFACPKLVSSNLHPQEFEEQTRVLHIRYASKRGKLGGGLHSMFCVHLPGSLNLKIRQPHHLPRILPPRWANVRF